MTSDISQQNIKYICQGCGKEFLSDGQPKVRLYHKDGSIYQYYDTKKYCSRNCSFNLTWKSHKEKTKALWLKKYGVDNPAKDSSIKQKIEQTNIARYGYKSNLLSPQFQQQRALTMFERYGAKYTLQSKRLVEKIKQTNKEKCGCDWWTESEHFKDLSLKTKEQNLRNFFKIDIKTTLSKKDLFSLEMQKRQILNPKYNEQVNKKKFITKKENLCKFLKINNDIDLTAQDLARLEYIRRITVDPNYNQKIANTIQNKINNAQHISIENLILLAKNNLVEQLQHKLIEWKQQRIYINGHSSKELEFYILLLQNFDFSDIIWGYVIENREYDFFIKSKNCLVELNLYYTHGKKPFENSQEDLKRIEYIKRNKRKDICQSIIEKWTIVDPLKKQIAIDKKYNFLAIYPKQNFVDCINTIKEMSNV